jgi:hypothetical protein
MNSRLILYGVLLAIIVVSGMIVRNAAKRRNETDKDTPPSLVGGIFAFPYMEPFYPAPVEKGPSLAETPTLTGVWNSLTNETQFVILINDAGPFTVDAYVDGAPLGKAAQTVFSYPYLTVTFPGVTLATGEREVLVRFVKNPENWGFVQTRMKVENAPCRDYEETILSETDALFHLNQRQGELREGLLAFQRYLLLPCRYGTMNLNTLKSEVEGYAKAFDAQESEFWQIVAGKPLRKTEARLALKVFYKNWDQILKRIPADLPVVSPFVKPEMPEIARRIVTLLQQRYKEDKGRVN